MKMWQFRAIENEARNLQKEKEKENSKMELLIENLENQGLNPILTHTGGGVMVAYIHGSSQIIGVDEYSVCLYDSEMNQEELVFELDESLFYTDKFQTLATIAKATFNRIENN